MPDSELDRLDPAPVLVTLSTGFELQLQRLRTRQFFRLLKVLTHGAGPMLMQTGLDFRDDAEVFAQKLLGLLIIAIPDAENEFIQFLASMSQPAGVIETVNGKKLTKQQEQDNAALWERFNRELGNPEPVDTIELVEAIIKREAPEMQALGKRLQAALSVFAKTGQDKDTTPEEPPGPEELTSLSVPSPQPSTSSPASTDGPTSTSTDSLFAASVSA